MKKLLLLAALIALPLQLFAQTCPPQAANAGFTNLAFTDTFGSSSDYTTTTGSTTVAGAKWYPNFWAMPSQEGGKVTISGGAMTLTSGNISTSPTWAYSTGTSTALQGTYYHAYFEARFKFAPSPTSYNSPVWPAFWLYGANAQAPVNNGNCGECDIFEAWPATTSTCTSVQTLHNWLYNWSGNTYISDSETANTEDENDMISLSPAYTGQAAATEKAQPTDGAYHTYGCLWTKTGNGTGQVQFYYDNYLVVHENGMTSIPVGAGTNFPGQEQNAMTMILQGNNTQPLTTNMVNVWTSGSGTGTTTQTGSTAQTVSGFPSTLSLSTTQSPYTLPATTSAGLSLTYTVASGPATVSGDSLKLTGTGTVVVNATQAGNSTYAAYSGTETITVAAAGTQTLSAFPLTLSLATTASPYTLPATTSAGLTVTYTVVSGPATVSGNTLTLTGSGTVVLNARQAGNSSYAAFAATETVTVTAASQTIPNFPATLTISMASSPYALQGTTTAGLTVTYKVTSGPATVSGHTLVLTGAGTVVLNGTNSGTAMYASCNQNETLTVSSLPSQTVSNFPATLSLTTAQTPYTLPATTSAGLTLSYTVSSGPATVSGDTLKLTGTAGTVVVKATQAGNSSYAAYSGTETITVTALTQQTVSNFPSTLSLLTTASPYSLPATTSAGLTLSYTVVSGPATVSGHTLTLTGAGTVVLTASQAGNSTYGAFSGSEAITVTAAQQTVANFPSVLGLSLGQTPYSLPATTSAGLTITYKVASGPGNVSGNTLRLTSNGTVVVDANQSGNATYASWAGVETITVTSLTQQTVNNFPATQNGSVAVPVTLSATTSAGQTITYTVVSGPATISGDKVTFTGTGTVVISATAAGNSSYAAYSGTETISVNASATMTFAQWEALYFNATQMASTAISGPTATPENDGVPNLLKYLYDINPAAPMTTSEYAAMPVTDVDTTTTPGTTYLTLTYRQYSGITGITVQVQTSPDLQNWTTVTPNISHQIGTDSTTGDPIIEDEVATGNSAEFIRLNVTQP